jgi:hypothetical protein
LLRKTRHKVENVDLAGRAVGLTVLTAALSAALLALAWAHRSGTLPAEWSPWVPLDIDTPPNLLTRYKLSRLTDDGALCARVLADSALAYRPVAAQVTGPECGLFDAVTIERSASDVGQPFSLTCRAAVSLALWEQHVVGPAAEQHFGSPVQRIEHFGSYACRNVYGRPNATRSRHATAEAFDVAGFVPADGRRIRVLGHWGQDAAEARFLKDVRDGACRVFDGVLSPDYNAAHRDHLHLDRGPRRYCR